MPTVEPELAQSLLPPEPSRPAIEDPVWSGWDVLLIVGVTVAASFVFSLLVIAVAKLFFLRSTPFLELTRIPELLVLAQFLAYVLVFAVMYSIVRRHGGSFWRSIGWKWPGSLWFGYVVAGGIVFVLLAGVSHLLPIPRDLPIDRFFENARQASIMSVFAVTAAPLMEELFFRGFLYPVLARRLGVMGSILLTSVAFGLLHGSQLRFSWAVLIIFLVGVVLTTVRALTRSVAASFLLHVGYNLMISLTVFIATSGFRHLEKLKSP